MIYFWRSLLRTFCSFLCNASLCKQAVAPSGSRRSMGPLTLRRVDECWMLIGALQTGGFMSLLHTKRVGLILRVFSPKSELVEQNVRQVVGTVNQAISIKFENRNLMFSFSRIDVLVLADSHYEDSDCGETMKALLGWRDALEPAYIRTHLSGGHIHFSEVTQGDIYCAVLNHGIAHQMLDGDIDYSMILSSGVKDYLTVENMRAMLEALEKGARVTGLAITELAPSILDGRIANTCAIWDNVSLMTVGGFDLRASKPRKDSSFRTKVHGWAPDKQEFVYDAAGVEEIFPLVKMVKLFGPCIAPILPVTGARWVVSDDPDVQKRETGKLGTKFERQMRWLAAEDVDLSFLKGGIMPEYRQTA